MKKVNRKSWIVSQLRRISLRWPPRGNAMRKFRRELPRKRKRDGTLYKRPNYEYQCQGCKKWFKSSEVQLDHIIPIMDPKECKSMSDEEFFGKFIVGLFCYEDNFQTLCKKCHFDKSQRELKERTKNRKKL